MGSPDVCREDVRRELDAQTPRRGLPAVVARRGHCVIDDCRLWVPARDGMNPSRFHGSWQRFQGQDSTRNGIFLQLVRLNSDARLRQADRPRVC